MRSLTLTAVSLAIAFALACGSSEPSTPITPNSLGSPDAAPADEQWLETLFALADLDALRAKYGDKVGKVTLLVNEAGDYDFVAIYADDRLEVIIDAGAPHADPPLQSVTVRRPDSPWLTASAVRTGTTLAQLEALNEGPFELGPSPEGIEATFTGPKLANHYVRLGNPSRESLDLGELVDWRTRSDKPAVKQLDLVVVELTLRRPN